MSASATALQSSSHPSETHSGAQPQRRHNLELRIYTRHVGLYPRPRRHIRTVAQAQTTTTTMVPSDSIPRLDSTCLLSGALDEFLLFSRQENSQWLIDVAHDICDPALRRGSLEVLDETGQTAMWRVVTPAEPLIASVYFYIIQDVVSLSKISARSSRSQTEATGYPSTMAGRVKARDGGQCWVSRSISPLMNSHLCPKRMGDHLLQVVYRAFVGTPPTDLSIYHERCGITLNRNLDAWFDTYELGLRLVAQVQG